MCTVCVRVSQCVPHKISPVLQSVGSNHRVTIRIFDRLYSKLRQIRQTRNPTEHKAANMANGDKNTRTGSKRALSSHATDARERKLQKLIIVFLGPKPKSGAKRELHKN